MPDKDSWIFLYCAVLIGIMISYGLSQVSSVAFSQSIWISLPLSLVFGVVCLKVIDRVTANSIRKLVTPIREFELPGIGALKQFPDHCDGDLIIEIGNETKMEVPLTFDTDENGPTEAQIQRALEFKSRYPQMVSNLRKQLFAHLESEGGNEEIDSINVDDVTVAISDDDSEDHLQVYFATKEELSDMFYAVCLRDWEVVEIYGGD